VADCHAIVAVKSLKQLMRLEPKTNDKVQRLTVRLSSQLMQEIEELAHTKRLTFSQLLREAVQTYIATIE
jgi:predicted DNA binding CopG/RHH family protein